MAFMGTSIREINPLTSDIEEVVSLEAKASAPTQGGTLDPPETPAGIERFLISGGKIFVTSQKLETLESKAFLEMIPLEAMARIRYDDLQPNSPLRQIAQRHDLFGRAEAAYSNLGKEVMYIHGIGAVAQHQDGSKVAHSALNYSAVRSLIEHMKSLQTPKKIYFGYVDMGPKADNINLPPLKIFLRHGAVIDGWEDEVYAKGVPYVRVSHGANYRLYKNDSRVVDLSKRTYKDEIRKALEAGYIGAEMKKEPDGNLSMVFYKLVGK